MAPKFVRLVLHTSLILAALLVLPPAHAFAENAGPTDPSIPTLDTFVGWEVNGQASQLRGVYVPGLIADTVVQQPPNQGTFISPWPNILTQFEMASSLGSTGLLAHNYLGGAKFASMQSGAAVYLVYGDGRTAMYVVTQILRYQALQPNSPYSNFVDLSSGRSLGASDLFSNVYGRRGSVVFQTCIASNGISSWGRLFIIAEPVTPSVALK